MNNEQKTQIVDKALDLLVFTKTRDFPEKFSNDFFALIDKLHQLEIAFIQAGVKHFGK